MDECRSDKVRKILQLEGRAAGYRSTYESGMAEIAGARHRAEQYKHEAAALKVKLTPQELHQLRRARSGV
ncbi:MAG: hypothetical protein HYY95_07065 [Candidatus Rokubacteria bacterium]|nr:hypothetical protein [Candidatus Rokubacteria bacterium]MBI3105318.1 hypothetical protein [Candidatus Rokubacteria bacterium]